MVWGEEVKPGEADNAPHMTHMWEPLRVFPKPLLVHVFSEAAAQVYCIVLRAQSFEHRRHQVGNHQTLPHHSAHRVQPTGKIMGQKS